MAIDSTAAEDADGWNGAELLSGPSLDAAVAALSVLMIAGIALDFRAHAAGISFEEEGFLTPEHVFFYSMFLGIAAVLGAATYRRRLAGRSWLEAVPDGYGAGVLGVFLFGLGGVGDFGWHTAFGFETGVEALTSPSHIALALGAALFLASPLRATWRRDREPTGHEFVPALVSCSLVLSVFALFTTYVNPIINLYAAAPEGNPRTLGVVSLLVFPAILLGGALALLQRFQLPPGGLALTFLGPAAVSAAVVGGWALAVPVVVAGLAGDALVQFSRPSPASPRALRLFGAAVPAVLVGGYLLAFELRHGVAWTIHVWTGTVVLAALAGLSLTFVQVPDATPAAGGAGTDRL